MVLSWNEIKRRAIEFSKEWKNETRERAEKDSFWNDFFEIFGISRRRVANFEAPVEKLNNQIGFIDLFWKGTLLVEHKSRGKSLDAAFLQATDYFYGLKEYELPKFVLVSDFDYFRLYDLEEEEIVEFHLVELHENIQHFGFMAGYQKKNYKKEGPVSIEAAELMGKLHDELKVNGYSGHKLEMLLVRLLFCLFADDTGIFEKDLFREFVESTREDGSDLGIWLEIFFETLNTEINERQNTLDERLQKFPYINGGLFKEQLKIASFNSSMREMIIKCSTVNWGQISPAIFGSMFQSVMDPDQRRDLGAHYTSEENIMKVIEPLFLNELKEEFNSCKNNRKRLQEFHNKLASLKFLDPACGCGNFLILAYREIRLLEIEVLKQLLNETQLLYLETRFKVDVDQFIGIEIDEFPARIAEVAMWLMDHQMNLYASEKFGKYLIRLPLKKAAKIYIENALRIDWEAIISKNELTYILGNPPFYGKQLQTEPQKSDMKYLFGKMKGMGVLDYVTAWYIKAAEYIQGTRIKVGLVSTNSITQGEQVVLLWKILLNEYKIKILFAHKTFKWKNKARNNAAVHVVIIGFGNFDMPNKQLYDYDDIAGPPHEIIVDNINPYLIHFKDVLLEKRRIPLCDVPVSAFGNMPNDGGFLIFSDQEKNEFLELEPGAKKYFRRFLSASEFFNNKHRWCLWLLDCSPHEIKAYPAIYQRVQMVYNYRSNSKRKETRKLAQIPYLFGEIRQPDSDFILIPRHSSEKRKYIPFGFFSNENIIADSCISVKGASLYHFGVLQSEIHMIWVKNIAGKIKSDYRYSNQLVYNNFPWPEKPAEKKRVVVENASQKILNIRSKYHGCSLADLYDPLTMPEDLVLAHKELDKAVDSCYSRKRFKDENMRLEFLFSLYEKYLNTIL